MPTAQSEMKAPVRPKHWKELTADEKIERMRERVQQLQSQNDTLRNIVEDLRKHEHIDGGIVVPMKPYYGGSTCEAGPIGEVYF